MPANNPFQIVNQTALCLVRSWAVLFLALSCWCLVGCKNRHADTAGSDANPTVPSSFQSADAQSDPSEDFQEQLQRVREGNTFRIEMATRPITHVQLQQLVGLPALQELILDEGTVDDVGMGFLRGLPQLRHLRIRNSPLTDAAFDDLGEADFPSLRVLNLPQSRLTSEGLKSLSRLKQLVQLRLGGQSMDDRAADSLSLFPRLQSLHLIGPKWTDEALTGLASAPELATLYLDDCKLSDAAWSKLLATKPALHVHLDQVHRDR